MLLNCDLGAEEYILEELIKAKFLAIPNANFLVIHGGGWKKLENK